MPEALDDRLLEWATPTQARYLEAVNLHQSCRKAATALGVAPSVVSRSVTALKAKAASQGYSPEHHMTRTVPEGFKVRGVSTYYDAEGQARGQWVKSSADQDARDEAIRAAYEAMAQDLPRLDPIEGPRLSNAKLCNVYIMTDCHLGALAWRREGGADWDLKIAERTLTGCFEQMIRTSPDASVGLIAQLGDFLHYDGLAPVTPSSGHILDADGRFPKLVEAALRVLRRMVDVALMKHQRVVVLMAEGNHDLASSVWLRAMFRALYENEPRLEVIDSELPYYVYQHGQTMVSFHHGHLKKNDQLPLLFASQFPVMWGATVKRYAHTGHRHHLEEREHSGMTITQHPTLAARDAYAARGGWLSERQACSVTYHTEFGQVGRNIVCPEMLEAAA